MDILHTGGAESPKITQTYRDYDNRMVSTAPETLSRALYSSLFLSLYFVKHSFYRLLVVYITRSLYHWTMAAVPLSLLVAAVVVIKHWARAGSPD